ncbi:Crp/Fnr family transcriptional regulator [Crocosphaera sp. UHCC 0190]|uniref:Crp/Fnr family transcriptional regulator n=1 Tax=Crocosphaera sp. UHCC 0190 TaxID=3110246 RepID=UPI002B1F2C35|nr:Crp/Fnr family transcriptional regulator [Crocosphaera sp. UHCC 0190]MEA5508171.1 Crp/Fnr family transcriptional regulator [Crocosphaera sp. UHCC 0190]
MNQTSHLVNNQLLRNLPKVEYQRIKPHLEFIDIPLGQILYEPNQQMEWVYFPENCVISLVSILSDNSMTEIGLIGNEGMVGLPIILGVKEATHQAIVQWTGTAIKISSKVLKQEFQQQKTLYNILLLYTAIRLNKIAQTAVCKSNHQIKQQFCRWLLSVQDSVQSDEFCFTQILISKMLGVRRASVTQVAQQLRNQGIINYQRGRITIINRRALENNTCECYHFMKNDYYRLLGAT